MDPGVNGGYGVLSALPVTRVCKLVARFVCGVTVNGRVFFLAHLPDPALVSRTLTRVGPSVVFTMPLIMSGVIEGRIFPRVRAGHTQLLVGVPIVDGHVGRGIHRFMLHGFNSHPCRIIINNTPLGGRVRGFFVDVNFPVTVNCNAARATPLVAFTRRSGCITNDYNITIGRVRIGMLDSSPRGITNRLIYHNVGIVGNCCGGRRTASTIVSRSK